jgi:DNA-binding response OmpR family regulator
MKRRILLVDDEVAVLLAMKAVLEISGFEVETAASAREGKSRLRTREYNMVITDMRMENDAAGHEVIVAARSAPYRPAVALLTAFPVDEGDWQEMGAHQLLLKPMHTRVLLQQIEQLFQSHEQRLATPMASSAKPAKKAGTKAVKKAVAKKAVHAKKSPSAMFKPAAKKKVAANASSKPTAKPTKKPTAKPAKKSANR